MTESTAVMRGWADPSASGPAFGTLAHAATIAAETINEFTPIRTRYLTVLAYTIMTLMKTSAPKATELWLFGSPENR